jgi:tight adherence protein C
MLYIIILAWFLVGFSFVLGVFPLEVELRPTLHDLGYGDGMERKQNFRSAWARAAYKINKPICVGKIRTRLLKELSAGHVSMTPEEFFLIKEACIAIILLLTFPFVPPDMLMFWGLLALAFGYMLPEQWLKKKIKNVKSVILRELPDAVDLLGLCVNAGLDFMLALQWVVEKSPPSVMTKELNILLQEINVGKTRRDALRSMADKHGLADVGTFARTLIQADKMGTSVSEALNILAEDMREARYRRGEQMAMKAPMKLLVPLLLFIFPVVGILVAGPIIIQFMTEGSMSQLKNK